MTLPRLTDRAALTRARMRARRHPGGMADFLHRAAATEFEERLELVNRSFNSPAVISGFPELWTELIPNARQVLDTDVLDINEGAHDLIVHAMALHWADDPVGQLVQANRALKPDGLFLGCLFGGETLSELRDAMRTAEIATMGGLSPRVAPMGEIRDVGSLLQRADFALPVADSVPLDVTYETPFHLIRDLRAMGESNVLAGRHRASVPRDMIFRLAEVYAVDHSMPDGRIPATFELLFLTGWAPDASHPKPMRPGSAASRLADALGTDEVSIDDPVWPSDD